MLYKVKKLFEELNENNILYCHWKSNIALSKSVSGQTDIDLLIHRRDANLFRIILSQHYFKLAVTTNCESFPSVEHYFGLDEESGILVHVHAYFRVITGESLAKNYRLPIDEMLLQNTREIDSVRVPIKSAELVVFTLRMILKHTSLMEIILLARYWKQVPQELKWLLDTDSIHETLSYVNCWLPSLNPDLFSKCIMALKSPTSILRRVILGYQLRSQLQPYARHSAIRAWLSTVQKFSIMLFRRLTHAQKGMVPRNGGVMIAFVGSEATGKSTLLAEMKHWLGEHFAVKQIHVGKPRSTIFSVAPNLFVPILRTILPRYRSTHIETQFVAKEKAKPSLTSYPLIFAIRSALLAYDRQSLLTRAYSQASNGTIVLCDRYPSLLSGAPDSPQLSHLSVSLKRISVRRLLAHAEARLYQKIPPPDLIIYLSAPLELTVSRNAVRGKKEPEDYVRRRHARSSHLEFGKTPVHRINTEQSLDQTVLEIKKIIWHAL